ncbi:MAG: hypothetical protein AB8G05_21495 [Oligoflexales bacterium]
MKKNHKNAILGLKKNLPKPITIKLNSIRNYKKSTYYQYENLVHGKKVCGQFLRILFDESGKMTVVGKINQSISIKSAYEWEDIDLSEIEKSKKIEDLDVKEIVLVSLDNCLQEKDGELLAISKLELFINGLKWQAEVHKNKILTLEKGFLSLAHASFSGQGSATIFDDNIGQETKKFELNSLEEKSSFLCSRQIITSKTKPDQFTQSESRNYNFSPDTEGFRDSSVFTNAHTTLEWFKTQGWDNWSTQQINIILDREEGPVYYPSTKQTLPTIYLPNHASGLSNMQVDKDVIAHELAHHYLFEFWSDATNFETVILHEALADFFTIAKSSTPCVAERICSEEGSSCISPQCLRSAINQIRYNDDYYNSLPKHLKSQVVSGMLWTAHTSGGIDLNQLVNFAHASLPLTPNNANIADFVNAILIPAREASLQADISYHCNLFDSAKSKGLDKLISDNEIIKECK